MSEKKHYNKSDNFNLIEVFLNGRRKCYSGYDEGVGSY